MSQRDSLYPLAQEFIIEFSKKGDYYISVPVRPELLTLIIDLLRCYRGGLPGSWVGDLHQDPDVLQAIDKLIEVVDAKKGVS